MCNELFLGGFYFLIIFSVNLLLLILVKNILDNFKEFRKIKKLLIKSIGEEKLIPSLFFFLEKSKIQNKQKLLKNFQKFFSRNNPDEVTLLNLINFFYTKKKIKQNYYFELVKKEFNF